MNPTELAVDALYYVVSFADGSNTQPVIRTYRYLGSEQSQDPSQIQALIHSFKDCQTQDTLELADHNLDLVHDVPSLVAELHALSAGE